MYCKLLKNPLRCFSNLIKVKYEQGQYNNKIREYFYFIDHQGMVFLDDSRMKNFTSSFKDTQFISFLLRNLKLNNTPDYQMFPYLSYCGPERNYIRCDDLPIVFTHMYKKDSQDYIAYGYYTGERLAVKFEPDKLYMDPNNGRVYYPTNHPRIKVGLVRSQIAIELSSKFIFNQDKPVGINWNGEIITLNNSHVPNLLKEYNNKIMN